MSAIEDIIYLIKRLPDKTRVDFMKKNLETLAGMAYPGLESLFDYIEYVRTDYGCRGLRMPAKLSARLDEDSIRLFIPPFNEQPVTVIFPGDEDLFVELMERVCYKVEVERDEDELTFTIRDIPWKK